MPEDVWKYEVVREGEDTILRIDCERLLRTPSIEDDPLFMAKAIDLILEVGHVTKIVFFQKRDFEYDYDQAQLLVEVADIYKMLTRQPEAFSLDAMTFGGNYRKGAEQRYLTLQAVIFRHLKEDPLGAYVELKRLLRDEHIRQQKMLEPADSDCSQKYQGMLSYLLKLLDKTKLVALARQYLEGYRVGMRDVYREIFQPNIKPDFMFTRLMAAFPPGAEEIDSYVIGGDTEITIFKFSDSIKYLYHVMPPEFRLSEEKYDILDMARKILAEHKPTRAEFVNPQRMREVFYHVGHDLIEELLANRNLRMTDAEIDQLTRILVRYTVGFGLIEVLLQDDKIQDISVNSPLGRTPLFIVHGDYADCDTNIVITNSEAESWASKLRMISGRPLDEANPILDTELRLGYATARVAAINQPLDPTGLAYSFRRHRNKPWTLPLFIKHKMISAEGAGLLSFLVDGTRTMLIAGTRSSGKSSFLTALMVEIMRRYRVITIEDTLELPTDALREMGFNIQSLKVASALVKGSSEVSASDGIRSTLRLGDSSLIIGEVRSAEAISLYEAMRVGAAANVVAGTIHGDSPYGVFDRVVNDIGVPKTSFKATDIIIVANPIRSPDGIHRNRRITQITEVRKHWQEDPLLEGGFADLMKYDPKKDGLELTTDLINGESDVLKAVAGNVADFAGNWEAVWQNIELRAKIKKAQVESVTHLGDMELLEAPFTITCNDQFHLLSDKIKEETGFIDPKRIYQEWDMWLKKELKRHAMKEAAS